MPKVGVVSQVRMTSSRLPGKVLKKVGDLSLLEYHLNRLAVIGEKIVVATTINRADDAVVDLCKKLNVSVFRGSEHDVLSRYYETAKYYNFDVIVRVTSDCPLIDGELIRDAVGRYLIRYDENLYLSNCHQRTFPRGMDFEIFSFGLLEKAWMNATAPEEREHVTPYIWRRHDPDINIEHYIAEEDGSKFRLTVDEKLDFQLVEQLISIYRAHALSCKEIVQTLKNNPSLAEINLSVEQKKI